MFELRWAVKETYTSEVLGHTKSHSNTQAILQKEKVLEYRTKTKMHAFTHAPIGNNPTDMLSWTEWAPVPEVLINDN